MGKEIAKRKGDQRRAKIDEKGIRLGEIENEGRYYEEEEGVQKQGK